LLFLDAGSGIAGDMLVAALLDLGVPEAVVVSGLAGLGLSGYALKHSRVLRSSISGRHFEVVVDQTQPPRDYRSIVQLLEAASTLTAGAKRIALEAFGILARAEAEVHACPVDAVHFHEVGAVDSIVDTTAAAIALDYLGAEVVCSPLPMGRGTARTQHGVIPLPAPATLLCLRGVPTYDAQLSAELVTPTGACLVAAVATRFAAWPSMRSVRVGLGAGTKDFPDRANLLRIILADPEPQLGVGRKHAEHVVIEANIDDLSPEVAAYASQRALSAGALDVWTTPIGMKKGRAAVTISVLCRATDLDRQAQVLFEETSSLGLRHYSVDRLERPRRAAEVQTCYGAIAVKIAGGEGLDELVAPEYESCRAAAQQHGVPIRKVYAAALRAYEDERTAATSR
jgi:pyridinium-3,5-bisthiocarboxylic acid mononucleotide nickel chelatase